MKKERKKKNHKQTDQIKIPKKKKKGNESTCKQISPNISQFIEFTKKQKEKQNLLIPI